MPVTANARALGSKQEQALAKTPLTGPATIVSASTGGGATEAFIPLGSINYWRQLTSNYAVGNGLETRPANIALHPRILL